MLPSKLAFVDIETTGTSMNRDRIIEVGVIRVENNKVVGKMDTLVNPEVYLPDEITSITGINAGELDRAPNFSSIRKDLYQILEDCVFVAHNVRFDYGFIKNEFRREEMSFKAKNLCTVKLSRNLFPRYHHHSLDHIIERFDIKCQARHRAFGDAEVLWKFYKIVQKQFDAEKLDKILGRVLKRPSLPIGVSEKMLDDLPEGPGVYIFYGHDGMPLYVGKSVNIHDRVLSHFSGDTEASKEMKIAQQVESIETFSTAGELGALFKEAKLVKEMQPLYNRQLRRTRKMIVIKMARPLVLGASYNTVRIEETDEINPDELENILGIFKSKMAAKNFLLDLCKENQLCEKLLGLEKGKGECFSYRLGKCRGACVGRESPTLYNGRFVIAFSKSKLRRWPFEGAIAIEEKGLEDNLVEKHIVDRWCYLGTIKSDGESLNREIKFDLDTYKILNRYLNHGDKRTINNFTLGPMS